MMYVQAHVQETKPGISPPVRRCGCGGIVGPSGECAACRAKRLATQARSAGKPLDTPLRESMERRFGHDFSRVRIHADAEAGSAAAGIGAAAFTIGQQIVFGTGRFAPGTAAGSTMLAHELAHTVQQRHAAPGVLPVRASTHAESEARSAASAVNAGSTVPSLTPSPSMAIARQDASTAPASTTPDYARNRQVVCVGRLGGCASMRSGGIPTSDEITSYNQTCRSESSYAGPDVTPTDDECRNAPATAPPPPNTSSALALAKSLATAYPGWLGVLPNCPCTNAEAQASPDWAGPGACMPRYHPGAATGYRSVRGYASIPGTNHGQQCCYDGAGALITAGAAAGTPDIVQAPASISDGILATINPFSSAPGAGAALEHNTMDVAPFNELGWQVYNQYWIPNNGNGCTANTKP